MFTLTAKCRAKRRSNPADPASGTPARGCHASRVLGAESWARLAFRVTAGSGGAWVATCCVSRPRTHFTRANDACRLLSTAAAAGKGMDSLTSHSLDKQLWTFSFINCPENLQFR